MAGRSPLVDELTRLGLVDKAAIIVSGDGSDTEKASQLQTLIVHSGSVLEVTAKAAFYLRHRLQNHVPESSSGVQNVEESPDRQKTGAASGTTAKSNDGRPRPKPPPGPHKSAFKKGNPGGPGGPPGNDNATKTGEHRNPLIHYVPKKDRRLIKDQDKLSPIELHRQSVQNYDARLVDMTKRLLKLQEMRKQLLIIEAAHIRQEGDGELAGTFRQAKQERQRVDDRIFEMHEAITRTQAKRDSAVEKLHKMEQAEKGQRKKGLADVLAGMRQGGDDDE